MIVNLSPKYSKQFNVKVVGELLLCAYMLHSLAVYLRHTLYFLTKQNYLSYEQGNGVFLQNVLFVKHCTDHKNIHQQVASLKDLQVNR